MPKPFRGTQPCLFPQGGHQIDTANWVQEDPKIGSALNFDGFFILFHCESKVLGPGTEGLNPGDGSWFLGPRSYTRNTHGDGHMTLDVTDDVTLDVTLDVTDDVTLDATLDSVTLEETLD